MPRITLPDGSERSYEEPTTPLQVASDIGPGLAKAALGAKIDEELVDLSHPIEKDCQLAIVTPKTRQGTVDPDGLYLIRHSAAHVMAEAIQRLFPGTLLVYGPPLETGFYYDMAFPEGVTISSEDFPRIEEEMAKIIAEDRPFSRYELASGRWPGKTSRRRLQIQTRQRRTGDRSRLRRCIVVVRHRLTRR